MTFFKTPHQSTNRIEIDLRAVSADSPEVTRRMDRIVENYQRLDAMLAEVETKIQGDDRLREINDSIQEIELKIDGRKRKWRSRKKSPKTSARPKKPR